MSRFFGKTGESLYVITGFPAIYDLNEIACVRVGRVGGATHLFDVEHARPAGCRELHIISGLQIILGSKPDTRKTFVIGIPLIFGLSLQALPELYAQVVPWLRPLFGSALTLATVLAVVLNLLLRVGGSKPDEASTTSAEG